MKERPNSPCLRALVLVAFFGLYSHAEAAPADSVLSPQDTTTNRALEEVREELAGLVSRWYGLMRIRFHDTQKVSAGLGAIFVKQPKYVDCSTGCELRGWHFEVEPGLYGIQGGVGWGKLIGETGRTDRLLHTVHFGWNIRGVVLRTWGDSTLYPQSQTLAGIEGSVSIIRLNISLGVLKSLYSGPGEEFGEDWIITTGFGWGF